MMPSQSDDSLLCEDGSLESILRRTEMIGEDDDDEEEDTRSTPSTRIADDNDTLKGRVLVQHVCILLVIASINLLPGLMIGWSVIVPDISLDDHNMTSSNVQWIISCGLLSVIPGNMGAAPLMSMIGPKMVMVVLLLFANAAWIGLGLTPVLWLMYCSRVLSGVLSGISSVLSQTLIAELSDSQIRGFASGMPEMMVSIGLLFAYVLLKFLSWRTATLMFCIPNCLTLILCVFVPESPFWLMRRNKTEEARKSLHRMLGLANKDKVQDVLNDIVTSIVSNIQSTLMDQIKLLKEPQNWKAVFLMFVLFILRELGGETVIFTYAVYLFQISSSPLDPFMSTIIVGVVRIICTFIGSKLMDRIGRRPLLLSSSVICCVVLFVAGGVHFSKNLGETEQWLSVACIYFFVASYGIGMGPIPWALMGELIPTPVRGVGCSLIVAAFGGSAFALSNCFMDVVGKVGICWVLLSFGFFTLLFTILTFISLPETKGRSLLELENIFDDGSARYRRAIEDGEIVDSE